VHVRTPDGDKLRDLLAGPGVTVNALSAGRLEIIGLTSDQIGDIAAANMVALHELTPQQASLEEAFMHMTHDSVEYQPTEVSA
jgi:ABC-2 type transport system ATP-binding protein